MRATRFAGGDWTADQLIPDLIRSFAGGHPCPIRNPGAIRPWQFVLEPLRGYLLLAEQLATGAAKFASPWNFGPAGADAKPVSWIADRMTTAWGVDAAWVKDDAVHPAEATVLKLDASKAAAGLGWRPAISLAQALDWTVEWYREWHGAGQDLGRLTNAQIERYEQLLAP